MSRPSKAWSCNPEGVTSFSPGLPYSATLGDGTRAEAESIVGANPEGVAANGNRYTASPPFVVHHSWRERHNPVGVGTRRDSASQGSRVRQPWAVRCNPVGIGAISPNSRDKQKFDVQPLHACWL